MMQPLSEPTFILVVDDNLSRIEYLEFMLYQSGFLTRATSVDHLETDDCLRGVRLVLSYIPFEPGMVTDKLVPVLFILPDASIASGPPGLDDPLVTCQSESDDFGAILVRIADLAGS